ncbi:hypothetical protein HYPSUDRAFT_210140 [Hypholoma sublateritium FD-334 SS-4]|uniref:Uncharacterized protein n=1 Tax=Hypholoma sublateritium (strain FD-334 SS-4) TaxID=945553 RepID=A0A0D2N0R1_HYPSF|nr:hypothetical protein HYPSUDRAFT_210140 [Hypholoma sublateritium FD-334 SS-4]
MKQGDRQQASRCPTVGSIYSRTGVSSKGSRSPVFVLPLSTLPEISDLMSTASISRPSSVVATLARGRQHRHPEPGARLSGRRVPHHHATRQLVAPHGPRRGAASKPHAAGALFGGLRALPQRFIRPRALDLLLAHLTEVQGRAAHDDGDRCHQLEERNRPDQRNELYRRAHSECLADAYPVVYRLSDAGPYRGAADVSFADSPLTLSRTQEIRRRCVASLCSYTSGCQTDASASDDPMYPVASIRCRVFRQFVGCIQPILVALRKGVTALRGIERRAARPRTQDVIVLETRLGRLLWTLTAQRAHTAGDPARCAPAQITQQAPNTGACGGRHGRAHATAAPPVLGPPSNRHARVSCSPAAALWKTACPRTSTDGVLLPPRGQATAIRTAAARRVGSVRATSSANPCCIDVCTRGVSPPLLDHGARAAIRRPPARLLPSSGVIGAARAFVDGDGAYVSANARAGVDVAR